VRHLKSTLRSFLRPVRVAGGRFFIRPSDDIKSTIVWKAAQVLSGELVEGDYLEFGVFDGASLANAFKTIRDVYRQRASDERHSAEYRKQVLELWKKMRFFGFDSFQGLPELSPMDRQSNEFVKGKFAYSLSSFQRKLRAGRVDPGKVVIVPGWFEQTCTAETAEKYQMKAVSIVNIDCDLYESTRVALRFIAPLMVDGTVLIFDDWYSFRGNPELGEQRAFSEWKLSKPDWVFTEYQKEGAYRISFIATRRTCDRVSGRQGPSGASRQL
jgi:O-methyltransferase